jgi:hypothetical protein
MSLLPNNHHGGLFIKAPADTVVDCLVKWGDERPGRSRTVQRCRLPLEQAWALLDERKFNPDRAIVVPVAGGWTAFFDNHSRQFNPASEQYVLAMRLNTEAYWFSYDDDADSTHRRSVHFSVERKGDSKLVRSVMLIKESRWEFREHGPRLPFERADLYAQRRKHDRINLEVLRQYADALGLRLGDPSAYGQDITFLKWGEQPPPDTTSSLRKLLRMFGRPRLIAGRFDKGGVLLS